MIPKFRAWDELSKKMFQVNFIDFIKKYVCLTVDENWITKKGINQVVLMQSTGLKDRNGVEIFEGDIVENTTQIVYLGHRFEVSWNGSYACFQLLNGGKSSNIPLIEDFMSYEVIGNIYENPELLEVTDE